MLCGTVPQDAELLTPPPAHLVSDCDITGLTAVQLGSTGLPPESRAPPPMENLAFGVGDGC
jgi:hypothetical protein